MIPKIIHLCWLSNDKFPQKIEYCINTWKKYLPDYEIRLWDLNKFDLNSSVWCKEAFENKKYAFAADYIRCYALYTEGGIYLDSDVEVLKSFNDLLNLPYFIGEEQGFNIEPAVIGCEKGWKFLGEMVDYYKDRHFVTWNGYDMITLPQIMSDRIHEKYTYHRISLLSDFDRDTEKICVFPAEYFSPKFPNGFKCPVTTNTYAVHHFAASWYPIDKKLFRITRKFFGYKVAHMISVTIKGMKSIFRK